MKVSICLCIHQSTLELFQCAQSRREVWENWKSCKSCIVGTPWTWVNRIDDNTGNLALGNWNCAFSTGRNSSALLWQHVLVYLAAIQEVIELQICNQYLGQDYKVVNLLSIYNSNIQKALEKDTNVFQSCRSKQKRLHPRPLIQKSPHLGSLPYLQWVSSGLFLPLFFPLQGTNGSGLLGPLFKIHMPIAQNPHVHCKSWEPFCYGTCLVQAIVLVLLVVQKFWLALPRTRACNRHNSTIQEP